MEGLFGAVIGAIAVAGGVWAQARYARGQAREDRVREARLDELRRTRRRLVHQIESLLAAALGKAYEGLPSEPDEVTNIGFLGSAELITAYQDLLIDLQAKFGAGVSAEDQARATIMEVRVIQALAKQEERLLRDEAPVTLPPEQLAGLLEPEYVASRFLALDQAPTLTGRLVRRLRRDRFRHPDVGPRAPAGDRASPNRQ